MPTAVIKSYENLANLNLIFAKADLAYSMKATMPIMNDRGIVDIKQARHPLINKDQVVPVDIVLGKEFDTLVITGLTREVRRSHLKRWVCSH